jgi:hypothetical protein
MRTMRFILLIILYLLNIQIVFSQDTNKRKFRAPIWTFHEKNASIYGISVGAYPAGLGYERNTATNGIRLEVPGIGLLLLLVNGSPIDKVDTLKEGVKREDFDFSEIVNGINISTGSAGAMNYNGISIAIVSQNGYLTNGIAIAGLTNSMNKVNGVSIGGILVNEALQHNGIQIGGGNSAIIMSGLQIGVVNVAKSMRGLQIGMINETKDSFGFQLGLWNKNEHRRLPVINWNFKKKK